LVRQYRKPEDKYSRVQNQVKELLNSPLDGLAKELLGLLSDPSYKQNIEYVSNLLERLPKQLDRHFYFDAWMVQSIMEAWSNDLIPDSSRIVPTRHHIWGYEPIMIPPVTGVYLIYIPPKESETIPSLLDYPWLCHELGHYLLKLRGHYDQLFNGFLPHLEARISRLKRMSISDRGLAQTRSQAVIDEIDARWRSSRWVQELAIDVIALWSCGPAYLAAFQDEHEKIDKPFIIESTHPPAELRTYALLQAARRLGWDRYLQELEQMQQNWYQKIPASIGNEYRSLRNTELIEGCLEAAFDYCKYIKIPPLRPEDLELRRFSLQQKADFSHGIELIVASWLVYHENEAYYRDWEERTLNQLINEILQVSKP